MTLDGRLFHHPLGGNQLGGNVGVSDSQVFVTVASGVVGG